LWNRTSTSDFVRRWFLPAGSRITDVITMLMNADTFEWFKYRYNLETVK
jgi:hypothetical protein